MSTKDGKRLANEHDSGVISSPCVYEGGTVRNHPEYIRRRLVPVNFGVRAHGSRTLQGPVSAGQRGESRDKSCHSMGSDGFASPTVGMMADPLW